MCLCLVGEQSHGITMGRVSKPLLLILLRFSRNSQNILYQHANQYHNTSHSTLGQILRCYFGEIQISAGIRFWLKKKKKKNQFIRPTYTLSFFFFFLNINLTLPNDMLGKKIGEVDSRISD